MFLSACMRYATRVGLGPGRLEADTRPIFWEVNVDKELAEVITPIVVVHQKHSVIVIKVELLFYWQLSNVVFNLVHVMSLFHTASAPGSVPLGLAPRVAQSKESNLLAFVF